MTFRNLLMLLACVIALGAAVPSTPALAQGANQVPLVVLRYNQPRIYYDKQLYQAVSKAVAIKPSVVFSVYSFVPTGGNDDQAEQFKEAASRQTAKFVADLKRMGVPAERINVASEADPRARYHELYMYVD